MMIVLYPETVLVVLDSKLFHLLQGVVDVHEVDQDST
jgi:hypothetical protein